LIYKLTFFNLLIFLQRHLNKKGNDLDLVEQFKIYEVTFFSLFVVSVA